MDLNQLKQFVTIAATENLTKASEILFVSQPALTTSLKKLEAELGCSLFHRDKNRIRLNDNGRKALRHAQRILNAAEEMQTAFSEGNTNVRHLTVYSSSISAQRFFIPRFMSANPDIIVSTKLMTQSEAERALVRGDCDLGFLIDKAEGSDIHNMPFCRDDLYAYLPESHPMAERHELYVRDLNGSHTMHIADHSIMTENLFALLRQKGMTFYPTYYDDYQIYRTSLKLTDNIAFVSSLGMPYYEEIPGRKYVRLKDKMLRMTIFVSYREDSREKLEPFFGWIRSNYKELLR